VKRVDERGQKHPALEVVPAALTLAGTVSLVGVVFGVGAVAAGASVAQACVMSLLVFTGASQLSFASAVAAGSTGFGAIGGATLLAARNMAYGLAMSRVLVGPLPARLLAAQLTLDESAAMAASQDEPERQRLAFWLTGAAIYVGWNLATLVGALAGSSIDIRAWGLDAAFPAAFVAMLLPQLRSRRGQLAAALGAVVAVAAIPLTPDGVPLLGAALAAVVVGLPSPPHEREVAA
jgi:4-azaleucine resistance transporter AzlC